MKVFAYVFSVIVFVALAVLYGVACWLEYGVWAIIMWSAMVIAIPLESLLHELGHMLFGAICGIEAKPHFSLFGSSSCEIIPKKENNLKTRVIITALGGILINLFISVSFMLFMGFNLLPVWCSVLIPANMYLAILNIMPAHLDSGKTDGLVVNDLLHDNAEAKVMLAVLTVQAQILNGKRIEEVDEKLLFSLPVVREDDPAFISLTELRYEYFKAKEDIENAEKYKTRLDELKEYLQ